MDIENVTIKTTFLVKFRQLYEKAPPSVKGQFRLACAKSLGMELWSAQRGLQPNSKQLTKLKGPRGLICGMIFREGLSCWMWVNRARARIS
jgi:hypothetical protein